MVSSHMINGKRIVIPGYVSRTKKQTLLSKVPRTMIELEGSDGCVLENFMGISAELRQ